MPDGATLYVKAGVDAVAPGIAAEIERLQWLDGRLPTPVVDAFVGDAQAWLVTEAVPGVVAGALLAADRRRTAAVVAGLADVMQRLHALPAEACPFDSSVAAWLPEARVRVAAGLVAVDAFDDDHRGRDAADVLAEVERLAGHASGRVVAHGDFTLGNIVMDDDGRVTGCLDVGRLGVADPYQDIAIACRDLGGFGPEAVTLFLAAMGVVAPDARRMLLHRALDELF